jgi:hypothetical protein
MCIGSVAGPTVEDFARGVVFPDDEVGRTKVEDGAARFIDDGDDHRAFDRLRDEPRTRTGEARTTATIARPAKSNFLPVIHSV